MKKIVLIIGYVLTLGLLYLFLKAKNASLDPAKAKFDVNNLVNLLGGKANIVKLTATEPALKIDLKDVNMVKRDALKKICNQGTILTSNSITILFGSKSKLIADKIRAQLG